MTAQVLGAFLAEAARLARDFEDSPLWRIANVREGALTIQQQAKRYAEANDAVTQQDAAVWAREGYMILSAALPDVHTSARPNERETGWATARDIGRLFGAEFVWLARVQLAFTPPIPDASRHNPSVGYLRGLIELTRLSQREVAARIGISFRLLKYYLTEPSEDRQFRVATYPVQFAIERIACGSIAQRQRRPPGPLGV